jgi:hypothetical protein
MKQIVQFLKTVSLIIIPPTRKKVVYLFKLLKDLKIWENTGSCPFKIAISILADLDGT